MKRKPEEKQEKEYPAQESGWEAKRLAEEQVSPSWSALAHTCTVTRERSLLLY